MTWILNCKSVQKKMMFAFEAYLAEQDVKALGALLCLIIVQGEAHSRDRLSAIAGSLTKNISDIRMPITLDMAIDLSLKNKGGQPWYPLPATWLIIDKWASQGITTTLETEASMYKLVRSTLLSVMPDVALRLVNIDDFIRDVSAAWRADGFDSLFIKNSQSVSETVGMTPEVRHKILGTVVSSASDHNYDDVALMLRGIDGETHSQDISVEKTKSESNPVLGKKYWDKLDWGKLDWGKLGLDKLGLDKLDWEVVEEEGKYLDPWLIKWREYLTINGRRRDRAGRGDGLLNSTASAYINEFRIFVMIFLNGRELEDLDEDELEALYVYALIVREAVKPKYHENAVRRLRDFHNYLVDNWDFPVIDISEKFPAWGSLHSRVEWYTEEEIAKILHAIDRLYSVPKRTRCIARLYVIIGVRLGLRPGETAGLEIDDIRYLSGLETRLEVRINYLGGLKTNNATRDMPLRILLSASEYTELCKWVNVRRVEEKAAGSASLWFDGNETTVKAMTDTVRLALNLLIKEVTGDNKARLYGLRHTFANNTLVLILSRHSWFERDKYANIDRLLSRWSDLAGTTQELIGCAASPTAALETLARLMGHASPSTTLRWYVHCLEWLSSMRLKSMQLTIPKDYALQVLNVPQSTWYEWCKVNSSPSFINNKCFEFYSQHEAVRRKTISAQPVEANAEVISSARTESP